MPRFFVPSDNIEEDKIVITGEDSYHIARALRMAQGDTLTVCDMKGTEYSCRLTKIRDEASECLILSSKKSENEPPVQISLYMAFPKGDKLEVVTQKAVELGCARIIPFESSRCIKRPKAQKQDKQIARLQKIATEAAKQCGRAVIPEISLPIKYKEMLEHAREADLSIFCYEGDGARSLKEILDSAKTPRKVSVVVGSEGGFSLDEAEAARSMGFEIANLGRRILRCETAPSYVLSCLSYKYEL